MEKLVRAPRGETLESHLRITARERQGLVEQDRKGVKTGVRAQMLLWLAQGYSWATSAGGLFCRTRTMARWKTRVEAAGIGAVLVPSPQASAWLELGWRKLVASWVTEGNPRDFGFLRSRWGCGVVGLRLVAMYELHVSA